MLLVAYRDTVISLGTRRCIKNTYSVAADPGADDGLSGCEDIDNGTEVGERSLGIANGGGTNGDSAGSAGRRGVGSVDVGVSSSDGDVDASVGE